MRTIYNLATYISPLFIRIAALFSDKTKRFINGRKGLLQRIESDFEKFYNSPQGKENEVVWFHCSSVGEFEQARPIIEWFKENREKTKIALTFFSPSGYELRKKYNKADWVYYLPIDTPKSARRFINALKPTKAIFTKYDLWYNFIRYAAQSGSSLYLISAIFRDEQPFFKWWGGFFRDMLKRFNLIFVQDKQSLQLLSKIEPIAQKVIVAGDTRFDRVSKIASESKEYEIIREFATGNFCVVAGSTWPPDEQLLQEVMSAQKDIKLIVAPHEIGSERIKSVEHTFSHFGVAKYSDLQQLSPETAKLKETIKECRVLIVDCIGILSALYKYADFSYIGGGFGAGIHNTLEAAIYGCPVAFGPKFDKFKEAKDLIAVGGARNISNAKELISFVQECVNDEDLRNKVGSQSYKYTHDQLGATDIIVGKIG